MNELEHIEGIGPKTKELLEKLKEMISTGMYYFKDNLFVLERIENNTSDIKVSITNEEIKEFIKNILESKLNNNYSKKK